GRRPWGGGGAGGGGGQMRGAASSARRTPGALGPLRHGRGTGAVPRFRSSDRGLRRWGDRLLPGRRGSRPGGAFAGGALPGGALAGGRRGFGPRRGVRPRRRGGGPGA